MDDILENDVMKMTFDSLEEAATFYKVYSRCVGFSVRKGEKRLTRKGQLGIENGIVIKKKPVQKMVG